jgi:anti-sigma regulatory factor (Ser/Thr protein kinase)
MADMDLKRRPGGARADAPGRAPAPAVALGAQPSPDGLVLAVAATADAPALARRAAAAALADWRADRREAALLVVSELVTNAVRHGSGSAADLVVVRVRRRPRGTRIEVTDVNARGSAVVAARTIPDGDGAHSGWGLPIVAQLTDRWGIEHRDRCTCVWCELDAA